MYAVATQWQRNPGVDPLWLVVSETHRDPLDSEGPRRFTESLSAAHWEGVRILHVAYAHRIAIEESQSDYTACATGDAAVSDTTAPAPDQGHPLASVAPTAPPPAPQWSPDAPAMRFWFGHPGDSDAVAIVILGGDYVPYDGEQVPAADPDPDGVREHLEADGSLCVRHSTGEACWAPRPDVTQHRPATWYLP